MGIRFRSICLTLLLSSYAFGAASVAKTEALVQGLQSYQEKDWPGASFYLRKAVTYPETSTDSAWYMLVMSEIFSEDYSSAINDCDTFLNDFSGSPYEEAVVYQKGRALHCLRQNDSAVLVLSDFCHEYPESVMYSSALFWIAECFYEDFNYDTARSLYERIVTEFPSDSKAEDAQYKLDLIIQREREQKLLYLLKMTGEEYLNSRENYERQLRVNQTENVAELRKQLAAARDRISELEDNAASSKVFLEKEMNREKERPAVLESQKVPDNIPETIEPINTGSVTDYTREDMANLKTKAALIQRLLDSKYEGK